MLTMAGQPGRIYHDPLYPNSDAFALGSPFGLLDASSQGSEPEAVPFGLRRAVFAQMVEMGDLSAYGFDHDQQIGTILDETGAVVPLLRHTTGATRTTTNPDGHRGPDSDSDHRED